MDGLPDQRRRCSGVIPWAPCVGILMLAAALVIVSGVPAPSALLPVASRAIRGPRDPILRGWIAPPTSSILAATPDPRAGPPSPLSLPHRLAATVLLGTAATALGAAVVSLLARLRSAALPSRPTAVALLATTSRGDPALASDHRFYLPAPAIFEPYFGAGTRRTVCTELVPGTMWGFEQNQELSALTVNIRCTVIRLADGTLWVHAPVFPTAEFLRQVDALGTVAHIVLPTFALEHKLPIITFSKKYPAACVWVVSDTWSWPINLPLWMLGIKVTGLIGRDVAPWASEIDTQVLKIDDVGSPFVEASFFHRPTKTLLLTDLAYCIPREPPAVVAPQRLLEVAPDDPNQPLPDTPDTRRQGWAKMALLVSFFIPARQRLVKGGKAEWQTGYMDSFDMIAEKLIVSPILQALVLAKSRALIVPWLEQVCAWDFERVVPAHYAAPVTATPADLRRAFGMVTGDDPGLPFPEEDMKTLNELQAIVKKASSGEGEVYTELFDKFFKNLFLEKSGWMRDR